jgi:hypothetical protein
MTHTVKCALILTQARAHLENQHTVAPQVFRWPALTCSPKALNNADQVKKVGAEPIPRLMQHERVMAI